MSADEMRTKFRDCAELAQDAKSARTLTAALQAIDRIDDVAALFATHTVHRRKSPRH